MLNKIWTSADFFQQWRAATVIPISKPIKKHTNPLNYQPVALTSCLCNVLERIINTRFIWYLDKYRILNRSQCGFRPTKLLVSLERYLQAIRHQSRISLSGRLPVFVGKIQGPQNRDHTLWRTLLRGRCSNRWGPCCDMFRTKYQWPALMCYQGNLYSTARGWLCTDTICFKQHFDTRYLVFYNTSPPRMFLSLDLLWEYRIQHGANGPLYVTSSYSAWIFCRGVSGFATDFGVVD